MLTDIPAPWKGFLEKLDTLLEEPVRLDCIGGFAVATSLGMAWIEPATPCLPSRRIGSSNHAGNS
jgi:hypothetical protein